MYVFYQTCVPDNQCQANGVEASQRIVEHTAPTSVYMAVYPTAAKRFRNVDYTEQDKAYRCERNGYIRRTVNEQSRKRSHPCSEILVYDYGSITLSVQTPTNSVPTTSRTVAIASQSGESVK